MNYNLRRNQLNRPELPSSITETLKEYSIAPVENDGDYHYGNSRINPKISGPYQDSKEIEVALCTDNWDVTEFNNSYIRLDVRLNLRFAGLTKPNDLPTADLSGMPVAPDGASPTGNEEQRTQYKEWVQNAQNWLSRDGATYMRSRARNILWDNQFVFFGLKCGTHVLRNYSYKFHDMPIPSTTQSSALYESFLYSNFKAENQMKNKKYIFSDYKEVNEFDNTICGVYIPLRDVLERSNNNGSYYCRMEIIIPFMELFALQAFPEYPNRIFGELKLVFTTTSEGFVHAEVNPITSIRKRLTERRIQAQNDTSKDSKTKMMDKLIQDIVLSQCFNLDVNSFDYLHAFNQIGIESAVSYITDWDPDTDRHLVFQANEDFTVYCDTIMTHECYCDVHGYKFSDSARSALIDHFSEHPFTIPAQKIDTYAFPGGPNNNGIDQTMNIRLNRVTDFEILMPINSRQRTVFCNPCLTKFQFLVDTWRAPDQLLDTTSPEFFTHMLQASDFDSEYVAPDAFERSFSSARVCEDGQIMPVSDDTCWVPIFSTERSNAGEFVFDGMNSSGMKVALSASPKYQNGENLNIYIAKDKKKDTNITTPAPILCCCCDTYWIFRLIDGYPNCQYVTQTVYNDAYNNPDQEAVKAYDR